MSGLDTTRPGQITYSTDELRLTVLGGIRLEGLDRMRVTLKLEVADRKFKHYLNDPQTADLALRHNLDLYNDTQVERFIRRAADRLEIGSIQLSRGLAELTDGLEGWRLEQIEQQGKETDTRKELTPEEREQAENFLKQPELLSRTNELIGKSGVIGEQTNRLLMYLIFTSRKREQPLHIVSLGSSGTGKTHLQEKVGELIPDEEKIEITTLSENAFYYFGQRELKNRLILIEDLDGAESVLYPLRELQSKKKISKTIAHKNTKGETRTLHLVVEGPVSVAGCTTRERIYEDNANRSFLIHLDESEQQDARIMDYQRAVSAGKVNTEEERAAAELLRNCQRLLEPIKVVNPFAEMLQIPREVFKPRRTNSHYLQFVEAITFYHQHQREQQADQDTGELYIETTLEDVEAANALLKETLLRKSDELSGACRNYFEDLKNWLKQEGKTEFGNREVRVALRVNASNQKRYMRELLDSYQVDRVKGKAATGYRYRLCDGNGYERLKGQIGTALDAALEKAKEWSGGPQWSSKASGPLKPSDSAENSKWSTGPGKRDAEAEKNPSMTPKRIRIEEGPEHTLRLLRELETEKPGGDHTSRSAARLTGRSPITEGRYLKQLHQRGILMRRWENREYRYRLTS